MLGRSDPKRRDGCLHAVASVPTAAVHFASNHLARWVFGPSECEYRQSSSSEQSEVLCRIRGSAVEFAAVLLHPIRMTLPRPLNCKAPQSLATCLETTPSRFRRRPIEFAVH